MSRQAHLVELPKVLDERGSLSFLEMGNQIPFEIRRVYWIYDVPGGEVRGSHAFRTTREIIISLSGSFHVQLHDGDTEQTFVLDRSYKAVHVPAMLWRTLSNFSTNSVALVISSTDFDEQDYIRDFKQFRAALSTY